MAKQYTEEQKKFLKDNSAKDRRLMVVEFNKKFNQDRAQQSITSYMSKKGWTGENGRGFQKGGTPFNKGKKNVNGVSGTRFKKGDVPWNAGTNIFTGNRETQYKSGNIPHNANMPIGHEYLGGNGKIKIKTGKGAGQYELKHRVIYQQAYGDLLPSDVVIFKDNDKRNFDPKNLIKVTKSESMILGLSGFKNEHDGLKDSVIAKTKLHCTILKMEKR